MAATAKPATAPKSVKAKLAPVEVSSESLSATPPPAEATKRAKDPTELTEKAMALVDVLRADGAENGPVMAPSGATNELKGELVRKGIAKIVGGGKGKGNAGKLLLITPLPRIIKSNRAPRGSGGSKKAVPQGKSIEKITLVPTPEQMADLLHLLKETEASLESKISAAAAKQVADLEKAVPAAKTSREKRDATQALLDALDKLEGLKAVVREQAFAVIKNSSPGTVARYITLLSPTVAAESSSG